MPHAILRSVFICVFDMRELALDTTWAITQRREELVIDEHLV
jgi:hypothetical protein